MTQDEAPPTDSWDDIAEWWSAEATDDPVYAADVHPLYRELTSDLSGVIADLGCGTGQAMGMTGPQTIGVDLSMDLLAHASSVGPTVRARLPSLACFVNDAFDHAASIYLLDLIQDDATFFSETARAVRKGGSLVVVMNHPVFLAPGSGPFADPDKEVFWRWGSYFDIGSSHEPAGHRKIEFFHRPLDVLLNNASAAGWSLDLMRERPLSPQILDAYPEFLGQDTIPRLLGLRWTNILMTDDR
ncbi:MAG: class I SAM-dependent methyltransferase [Acidimicrobiia bacterium]|nr:class I SAM-dependent methyltransferase [Acidimicrobiia bacterium]